MKLKEWVEELDERICFMFKQAAGSMCPMYHMISEDGTNHICPALSGNKDMNSEMMRALMKELRVVRYLFIDEAWIVETKNKTVRDYAGSLKHHPDRIEVLLYLAEDMQEGQLMGRRAIDETTRELGPLEIVYGGEMEGRLAGMLPPRVRQ